MNSKDSQLKSLEGGEITPVLNTGSSVGKLAANF